MSTGRDLRQGALTWAKRRRRTPVLGPVIRFGGSLTTRRTATIQVGAGAGLRFNPHGTNPGYALGTTEQPVQDCLVQHARHGDVVWDIGANVGFFTLIAARLVGDGKVIAFEPLAQNAAAIRSNADANSFHNIVVRELAVSDFDGEAALQIHKHATWAKLDTSADTGFKTDAEAAGEVGVAVSTLDSELESNPAPDIVKLDIEGAEVAALRGAAKMLSTCRPIVICEVHGTNEAVCNLLAEYDYDLSTLGSPEDPREADWNAHVLALPHRR